eukprot:CAMPEP_0197044774 /NCGR_PEP_ID=MMETSP1384-20130603/20761_1 /TAXON_ID=29189 /ORGANISM="Ammonia sp." /LENGTH=71 /DNA_ID=CAMNT_0042476285 /DNA_START=123 /DNA_END=335 /DNA_ORIENTATION=+
MTSTSPSIQPTADNEGKVADSTPDHDTSGDVDYADEQPKAPSTDSLFVIAISVCIAVVCCVFLIGAYFVKR